MQKAYRQLILGMICLFIVMAIGRFAYTPIMPFMQQTGHMDNQSAGLLATINYLGYLIGAIIPIWIVVFSKVTDLKVYLLINIVSTILMGLFDNFPFNRRDNERNGFCFSLKCGARSIESSEQGSYLRYAL